jgi:O-antigen ligase
MFALASLFGPRPIKNLLVLILVAALGYWIIPESYFDRLDTLTELEFDVSVMGRLENWVLAWEEAVRHPLFGVGPNNHIAYNHALSPEVQVRVAHSVYFQVLGELGFVGMFLYLWFMFLVFKDLRRALRKAMRGPANSADVILVRSLAFWLLCGFSAYSVGAGLLNMLYVEFPWYLSFYGSMLGPLIKRELENNVQPGEA